MFNPIIIVAIVLQSFISRTNRMAGAIAGFVITTGILLWGISLYAAGSEIAFFGFPLTEPVFFVVCAIWYGLDVRALLRAKTATPRVAAPPAPPQWPGNLSK